MGPAIATKYAKSGGVHIAYQASGSGTIDVLLLPDGTIPIEAMLELRSFERFIHRLETFARVIRFDRRGTGLSDPVTASNPPTLEQWTSDAEAVLDAVGSRRAALIGIAEGGFVMSLLAATRPARVAALVLVNASPSITAEPFRHWGLAADALDKLNDSVETQWGDDLSGIPLFAPSAIHDEGYRQWLRRAVLHSLSPAMADALFDVLFRSDIRDVLPIIGVPTLVIHRRGNRFLEPAHGRYLADHIPGARYLEVDGDDHVPYLGDPNPILDAIEEFLTGEHRQPQADRVLATILFVDIVRSTEKAAELGDRRWREVLLEYHELVKRQLEHSGGRKIDSAGDGLFASFDGPARAIRCAQAISESIEHLGLAIRSGVHTGECEVVEEKLGGIAVHIGARIVSLALPGEVLVSSTVRDLVAGSGIRFLERGTHRLKGVPEKWRLFAVAS